MAQYWGIIKTQIAFPQMKESVTSNIFWDSINRIWGKYLKKDNINDQSRLNSLHDIDYIDATIWQYSFLAVQICLQNSFTFIEAIDWFLNVVFAKHMPSQNWQIAENKRSHL